MPVTQAPPPRRFPYRSAFAPISSDLIVRNGEPRPADLLLTFSNAGREYMQTADVTAYVAAGGIFFPGARVELIRPARVLLVKLMIKPRVGTTIPIDLYNGCSEMVSPGVGVIVPAVLIDSLTLRVAKFEPSIFGQAPCLSLLSIG